MQIAVTGATGVLGHRLVERLADRGHDVYGLARDEGGVELVEGCGGTARRGDVLDPDSLESLPEVETLVHAATSIPTATKPTEEDWAQNDRVRIEGIHNLIDVLGEAVDHVLFPSVVWVARQPDGSQFDETAPRNPVRATRSAATVEEYLEEAGPEYGFESAVLRCGYFYAPDAAHTRQFGESLLSGSLPIVGGGVLGRRDAELSFVHASDAARAFADAVEAELSGCYHVVDDQPATLADFLETFADYLETSSPRRLPGWLAKFVVGSEAVDMLTNPMPTTNQKLRDAVGWEPSYPTYREGLKQVVETWETDGTLVDRGEGYEWNGGI
jgi:nucleoside-diphosphate-sugar epimerase